PAATAASASASSTRSTGIGRSRAARPMAWPRVEQVSRTASLPRARNRNSAAVFSRISGVGPPAASAAASRSLRMRCLSMSLRSPSRRRAAAKIAILPLAECRPWMFNVDAPTRRSYRRPPRLTSAAAPERKRRSRRAARRGLGGSSLGSGRRREIVGSGFAGPLVLDDLVVDLLTLIEAIEARALHGRDVHEHVRPAL